MHVIVAMALFSWVMIGIFVVFLGGIVLLGLYSPRSGADVLGWRPTRSPEAEARTSSTTSSRCSRPPTRCGAAAARPSAPRTTSRDAVRADQRELDRRAREYGEDG